LLCQNFIKYFNLSFFLSGNFFNIAHISFFSAFDSLDIQLIIFSSRADSRNALLNMLECVNGFKMVIVKLSNYIESISIV
jgi:hypothetical protein